MADDERNNMTLYVSKPTTIEAVHWDGDNLQAVIDFAPGKVRADVHLTDTNPSPVQLLAGKDGAQEWVPVPVGHWLVNQPGDKSDIWPVDNDYFVGKYEAAV